MSDFRDPSQNSCVKMQKLRKPQRTLLLEKKQVQTEIEQIDGHLEQIQEITTVGRMMLEKMKRTLLKRYEENICYLKLGGNPENMTYLLLQKLLAEIDCEISFLLNVQVHLSCYCRRLQTELVICKTETRNARKALNALTYKIHVTKLNFDYYERRFKEEEQFLLAGKEPRAAVKLARLQRKWIELTKDYSALKRSYEIQKDELLLKCNMKQNLKRRYLEVNEDNASMFKKIVKATVSSESSDEEVKEHLHELMNGTTELAVYYFKYMTYAVSDKYYEYIL